ncbi:hypothetical protein [Leclercia adecarboxylata]|uniref:hypothetical protein n=1 Tax=Leclercia adecarboxylata TaxID=83655 RepID=UPI0013C9865C|nr:hypothetical protein [Leclercia adecarboxylata]NEG94108.1 hypothetical protein [Leclercia adecarboxylata]
MNDKAAARDPRSLNSMKDTTPATAHVHMRVTPDRKFRYVRQAEKEGLKLAEWIQKHMDAVCDAAGTPITNQTRE